MNAGQIRLNYPYFARKSKNRLNYVKRIVNLRPKLNLFIWYSGGASVVIHSCCGHTQIFV